MSDENRSTRHRFRKPSALGVYRGQFEGESDYHQNYGYKEGERASPYNNNDNLANEGDYDFSTDKNDAYKQHEVSRPSKNTRRSDNLGLEGSRDNETDYSREYGEKTGDRYKASRPKDYLNQEGDHDFSNDKGYSRHDVSRPDKYSGRNDNLALEGVRDDQTDYNREYNAKTTERSRASRPADKLNPDGEHDFTNDKGYRSHSVSRPERYKGQNDNLGLDGDRNDETDYSREYGEKRGDRSRASRPQDRLNPEGDHDFDNDKGYRSHSVSRPERYTGRNDNLNPEGTHDFDNDKGYRSHSVSRPDRYKGRDDNLGLDGERNNETDYNREYGAKQGERSRASKPSDRLNPEGEHDFSNDKGYRSHSVSRPDRYTGRTDNLNPEGSHEFDTDKGYRSHSVSRPDRYRGREDNLALDGERNDETDYNREYGAKQGEKSRASRPSDRLNPEGDHDFNNDKGYRSHSVSRPERYKGRDDNLGMDGDIENETDYKKEYGKKTGERSRASRPRDRLNPDGEHDFNTDKGYRSHSVPKPSRYRGREDNLNAEGEHDFNNDKGYRSHSVSRPDRYRGRDDTLYAEGEHDFDNDKGYRRHSVSRPNKYRGRDDHLAMEGDIDGDTDYKREFGHKKGERSRGVKPADYLAQEGEQDFDTDKGFRRHSVSRPDRYKGRGDTLYAEGDQEFDNDKGYRRHSVSRPDRYVGREDNLAMEGNIDDDTENKREYNGKYAKKPDRYKGRDGTLYAEGEQEFDIDKGYRRHSVSRPDRYVGREDNLAMEGNIDDDTENKREFRAKDTKRPDRYKGRGDTLHAEGEQDFNNDKGYRHHSVTRPDRYVGREDNLAMEGDLDDDTENKREYNQKDTKRPDRYKGRDDTLHAEGEQEFDADKGYRRHSVARPDRYVGREDNLAMEGHLDDDTENKREYNAKHARREKGVKPADYLSQSGNHDFTVDKGYRRHSVSRPDRYVGREDNLAMEGHLDDDTEHKREYHAKRTQREKGTKPSDLLNQEGEQDFTVDKGYRRHSVSRPDKYIGREDNLAMEGRLDDSTDYRSEFHAKRTEKVKGTKPSDVLGAVGDQDFTTDKGVAFRRHSLPKPDRYAGRRDNLEMNGDLEDLTDYKSEFGRKKGERVKGRPKSDYLVQEGEHDFDTVGRRSYRGNHARRPSIARSNPNLRLNSSRLDADSEYDRNFKSRDVPKPERVREVDRRQLDLAKGRLESNTEVRDNYSRKDAGVSKPGRAKAPNNLALNSSRMTEDSETHSKYGVKQGRPAKPVRGDNLDLNRDPMNVESEAQSRYKGRRGEPAKPYNGNNLDLVRNQAMDGDSETRSNYAGKKGEPAKLVRGGNLDLNKDPFDSDTETSSNYLPKHGRRSGGKVKNNLDLNKDPYDVTSESRDKYGDKGAGKVAKGEAGDNLAPHPNGKFDDGTVTKYSYDYRQGFDAKKPTKVRQGTHLVSNGPAMGTSEYGKNYDKKKAESHDFVNVNDMLTPFGHMPNETKMLGQVQKAL